MRWDFVYRCKSCGEECVSDDEPSRSTQGKARDTHPGCVPGQGFGICELIRVEEAKAPE